MEQRGERDREPILAGRMTRTPKLSRIGPRPAFVYLLRCADASLYCGWTFDPERRLAAHRAGRGARYTRSRLPVTIAAVLELSDATSARREEARIKRLSRGEKLALATTQESSVEPRAQRP